jgi:hypothetical protein
VALKKQKKQKNRRFIQRGNLGKIFLLEWFIVVIASSSKIVHQRQQKVRGRLDPIRSPQLALAAADQTSPVKKIN